MYAQCWASYSNNVMYYSLLREREREVVCGQVWWPMLGICALHLTHPSAHTQQWTHTWSSAQTINFVRHFWFSLSLYLETKMLNSLSHILVFHSFSRRKVIAFLSTFSQSAVTNIYFGSYVICSIPGPHMKVAWAWFVLLRKSDMGHIWAKKSDLGHFSLQCELSLSLWMYVECPVVLK